MKYTEEFLEELIGECRIAGRKKTNPGEISTGILKQVPGEILSNSLKEYFGKYSGCLKKLKSVDGIYFGQLLEQLHDIIIFHAQV